MKADLLTSLGIDKKAAKIYLAALGAGTTSVQTLARRADLKRPTAYLHIEELVKQGLLLKVPIGKKELYRAAEPTTLKRRAESTLDTITEALPSLLELHEGADRPKVTILEGKKGIRQVYDELESANSIRAWSTLADINRLFGDEVDRIARAVKKNQISVKEIASNKPENKRALRSFAAIAGRTYQPRLDTTGGISNDNLVYGNTTALFRMHELDLYVVKIEDPFITSSQRALFDMAYERASRFTV